MHDIIISLANTAGRRLDWGGVLLSGESLRLRIEDPRETGVFTARDPADYYLCLATYSGALVGVAGPFEAVESDPAEEDLGEGEPEPDPVVVAWEADLDLSNDDADAAFASLAIGQRVRCWSGLLDTVSSRAIGTGDAVVEKALYLGAGGGTPAIPGSGYVRRDAFAALEITEPTTLSLLRAQLSAILAALKGT